MEKDLSAKNIQLDHTKRRHQEEIHRASELNVKLEKAHQKVSDLQSALKKAIYEKEEVSFQSNRITEENRMLVRKLDIKKGVAVGEFDEVEAYKKLLRCNSCEVNQKSTVLTRCMHVFCKECIDARLETRQRKCPNCGEPFGSQDVKQFYL